MEDAARRPRIRRSLAVPIAALVALAAGACGDVGPGNDTTSSCPYSPRGAHPLHREADPGGWLSDVPGWSVRDAGVLGARRPERGSAVVLENAADAEIGPDGRIHVADGELVARVRLPGGLRPERVGGDRVLGLRTTGAGVDQVVMLELVKGD